MTAELSPPRWDRAAVAVVVVLCALKALVHLVLVSRYGYHGDELYFLECGRHLAFGYVDHPPLIPWIARLTEELGGGLIGLRLPAIAAGVGTMAVLALLVRLWGGGAWAQALALLCLLVAPAHLRVAAMLNIPVFEVFWSTVAAYFVARALLRDERWTWLLAGGALGLAILAKHSSLVWGAALFAGILGAPSRRVLASRWPWLGGAIALAFFVPNLLWQMDNGFATLEFMGQLRHAVLELQGRALFLAGQLLYFHPLAVAVWLAGLGFAFTPAGRGVRPFALQFLGMFGFFLVLGGKPYYLASAYPALLAAGGVAFERGLATRGARLRALVASLALTGVALGFLSLPVLPIQKMDGAIGAVLGWAVPPMALTHDLHGMLGWDEHTATVDQLYRSLPETDRERVGLLVGSYSQAAAQNVLRAAPVPRAVSGHLTYYLWGPDPGRGEVLIAYGLPRELLEGQYRSCRERAHIAAPLARPGDRDLPVYLCRDPRRSLAAFWPRLRRFGHGPTESAPNAR